MKRVKLPRNSEGISVPRSTNNVQIHQSQLSIYINYFGIYSINKRHIKHT